MAEFGGLSGAGKDSLGTSTVTMDDFGVLISYLLPCYKMCLLLFCVYKCFACQYVSVPLVCIS